MKGNGDQTLQFFQIKITLQRTKPPIWRRIIVAPEIKLDRLHDVLQIVMGWTNSHLHQFETPLGFIADPAFGLEETESSKKTLNQSPRRPWKPKFGLRLDCRRTVHAPVAVRQGALEKR
jgi:hypothetical protein